ncbi:hypothetical protein I4U23_030576 [Adineta vaga]|nr:hypothetical protein I4U23_030576 [Adineta vaga]
MTFLTSGHILLSLLVLSIIIDPIRSYRFHDLQNVFHSDQIQQKNEQIRHNQVRSVLLPKICIKILKRNGVLYDINTHQSRHQPKRKCYPFDMR